MNATRTTRRIVPGARSNLLSVCQVRACRISAVTYTGIGAGLDALIRGRTTVYDREPRRQTSVAASVSRTQAALQFGVRW